jgi:hypothetical protein
VWFMDRGSGVELWVGGGGIRRRGKRPCVEGASRARFALLARFDAAAAREISLINQVGSTAHRRTDGQATQPRMEWGRGQRSPWPTCLPLAPCHTSGREPRLVS